jgi:hypothetical protein
VADWTAITGIVESGLLGPGAGALFASHRTAREHEYARVLGDRSELRALLDDAEQALRRAKRLSGTMTGQFLTHGAWTRERAGQQVERFHEAGRDVDLQSGRLALRLGTDHPAAIAYQEAFESVLRVSDALGKAGELREHADVREAWDDIQAGNAGVDAAHDRFLAAGKALVSSQLEPR